MKCKVVSRYVGSVHEVLVSSGADGWPIFHRLSCPDLLNFVKMVLESWMMACWMFCSCIDLAMVEFWTNQGSRSLFGWVFWIASSLFQSAVKIRGHSGPAYITMNCMYIVYLYTYCWYSAELSTELDCGGWLLD